MRYAMLHKSTYSPRGSVNKNSPSALTTENAHRRFFGRPALPKRHDGTETEPQSLQSALPSCRIIEAVLPWVLDWLTPPQHSARTLQHQPLSATGQAPADGRSGAMGRPPSPPQMRCTPLRRSG